MATSKESSTRAGFWGFLQHIHPAVIYPSTLSPFTTLGLGLIALYLFVLLLISGVLLMVYYVPDTASAYGSIQDLRSVVPFGALMRNVHRWAGHAMVAVVGLHLLRTMVTGAYKGRSRRKIWTAGVWLLLLTLAFAFTGYLLPWDQLSYWAVSIGGHLAGNVPGVGDFLRQAVFGGSDIGGATLVRFYALHVGILPLITSALLVVHLFRLRRAGGLARPQGEVNKVNKVDKERRLAAWPHLYEREIALLGLVTLVVLVAGLLMDAPLGPEPDLANPEDPSKAPWYFLFLQELVSYSALLGGVILPLCSLVFLYFVPSIDREVKGSGQWLAPKPARLVFTVGFLVGAAIVVAALFWHESRSGSDQTWLDPATALALGAVLAAISSFALARRAEAAHRAHLTLVVLCGLGTSALLTLTIIGWFRGPSWSLVLPWVSG